MARHTLWISLLGLFPTLIFLQVVESRSGIRSLDPRIINGTVAKLDDTRHQVSVRKKSQEIIFGTGHICGGSLIKPSVVLSAAHCFYDEDRGTFTSAKEYFVVMGTLDRFEPNENTLSYQLTHIVFHAFDRLTFENDLALMFLDGVVPDTNPAISVIELNRNRIPVGAMCQVTGWGYTELGMTSEWLMTVDVPIVDREVCSTNYGNGTIVDGMICAGYMEGEKDACQGDSGGPLVHEEVLVGIVSFGDGCAQPGFPGVYVDVRHYVDWIERSIKSGANEMAISHAVLLFLVTWLYISLH